MFSKKVNEIFKKTKNIEEALRISFWGTAVIKYPAWFTLQNISDIQNNNYIFKIFKYSYDAIKISYKNS